MPPLLNPDVPRHHQIYLQLRAEIADGIWVGRSDFPGEQDLARRFGVSVITSRKALSRLADEGWVERGRGRRTRVLRGPARAREAPAVIFPTGKPRPYSYKVLSQGVDVATAEACAAFGVPPGSRLWLCSRLRSFKGRPHSVTLNVQRPEIGARHSAADLRRLPMSQILRNAGLAIATMTRRVAAAFAPLYVASQLGITMQHPTLVYTFSLSGTDGAMLEWVRIFVHPDEPSPVEILNYQTGEWRLSEPL